MLNAITNCKMMNENVHDIICDDGSCTSLQRHAEKKHFLSIVPGMHILASPKKGNCILVSRGGYMRQQHTLYSVVLSAVHLLGIP